MTQTAYAVYENGVLRPTTLLFDLKEGQRVLIKVEVLEELTPEETARREAEFIRRMDAAGMVERLPPPDGPAPAGWQPLTIPGEPLSEAILRPARNVSRRPRKIPKTGG